MPENLQSRIDSIRQLLDNLKYQQAQEQAEILLADTETEELADTLKGEIHFLAGDAAISQGDHATANEHLNQATLLLDDDTDSFTRLSCELSLVNCHIRHANLRSARHLAMRALETSRNRSSEKHEGIALMHLGTIDWMEGRVEDAIPRLLKSIEVLIAAGEERLSNLAKSSLSIAFSFCDRTDDAVNMMHSALEYFNSKVDLFQMCRCLHNLAGFAFTTGDLDRAREYLLDCVEIENRLSNRSDLAITLFNLGQIEHRIGDYKLSRKYLNRAFQICQETKDRVTEANALLQLGVLSLLEHNAIEALNYSILAQSRMEGSSNSLVVTLAWHNAVFHLANGRIDEARSLWSNRPELTDIETIGHLTELLRHIQTSEFAKNAHLGERALSTARKWLVELENLDQAKR